MEDCEKLRLLHLFLGRRRVKPQAGDVGFVTGGDLDAPSAGMFEHRADRRHLFGQHEGKAAQGVDAFGDFGKARVEGDIGAGGAAQ